MPEELTFQLLDVGYEVEAGRPVIEIWARDNKGRRLLLLDDTFRPYFYALVKEGADPQVVAASIKRLSKSRSPITSADVIDAKYFGRPVKAVRVQTVVPETVREYREEAIKIPGVEDVLEADVRFSMRYLIDRNLYPMRWYRASGDRIQRNDVMVDAIYRLTSDVVEDPSLADVDPLEGLRTMAFDIEAYNPQGSPNPSKDPVIIIGLAFNDGERLQLTARGHDDKEVLREFIELVQEKDPDIMVGYNQNSFDWPYLLERAKVNGVRLEVGRKRGAEPSPSVFGHISVQGRLNVDLYNFAEEIEEVKVKTLDEVADYLGVTPKDRRVNIDWWRIAEYWDDPEKRKTLLAYNMDDVVSTLGLAYQFLPFGAQLSQISGLPLDQVAAASVAFRLEMRFMREAKKLGELVPNRKEEEIRAMETYTGAVVLEPRPGVHQNVAVLDFASMYPSIMVKYNVGPDTLLRHDESCEKLNQAPGVGHRFCADRPAFFRRVLERFLKWRSEVKQTMKRYPEGSSQHKLLNERQRAIKVLANASYGYMGWAAARWYCRQCAESVTAWGRELIMKAVSLAKSYGLKVYYGDTDSLFVENDPEKVAKLIEEITKGLEFDIKVDKVYSRVFFTEAKKRYAGLTPEGKVDIVGFEAVRGDWSDLAKETQAEVAETILRTGDLKKAVEYVRNVIDRLRTGKVEVEKLVIWKTLTKRLDEYEAEGPHVYAARMMEKLGFKVDVGSKVGYVIVKGDGPVSRRARPYFIVKPSEIDYNYYVDKQVVPAALRILEFFGVSEKELKTGTRQASLFDYLNKNRVR
ncbi:MAG: DNA-directed DNA polymerase [Acidilobus sp.]